MADFGYIVNEGGGGLTHRQKVLLDYVEQLKTGFHGKLYDRPQPRFLEEFEEMKDSRPQEQEYQLLEGAKSYTSNITSSGKCRNTIVYGETLKNEETNTITSIESVDMKSTNGTLEDTKHFDVNLNSVGEVRDTLESGKMIKRVERYDITGDEPNINIPPWGLLDTCPDVLGVEIPFIKVSEDCISNNFKTEPFVGITTKNYELLSISNQYSVIAIKILKTKLTTLDLQGVVKWLKANPTYFYYKLPTPIETTNDYDLELQTYKDTTHLESNTYFDTEIPIKPQEAIAKLSLDQSNTNSSVTNMEETLGTTKDKVTTNEMASNYNLMATTELYEMLTN